MPEHAHILRMTVDKHHHLTGAAAQTADRDIAGRAVGDPVAHDTAGGGEKSRHLFRQHRQQGRGE